LRFVYYNHRMTIVKRKIFRRDSRSESAALRTARHLARAAVDLVFPPRCVLCGGWAEAKTASLCATCATIVERERRQPACPRCAASVAPYEVSDGRCRRCRNHRPWVTKTVRVGPYHVEAIGEEVEPPGVSNLGRIVRTYKYKGREELEPILGEWLAEVVGAAPWLHRIEAIITVPTHWRHRLGRPLYAAEALAAIVDKRTGLPLAPVLKRVRGGPHQIGLSHTARAENVRGAFAVRRGVTLKDARVLLIDDVKTTGATINECAKVLRRGGAAEVYAAVVVTVSSDRHTGQVLSSI